MLKKIIVTLVMTVFAAVAFLPDTSHAKLADGIYSIPYQVNTFGKEEPSVGNDYFVKPAKLTVQNGKMVAEMTVKNAAWIVKLEAPNYKELSKNAANDTRVFQFDVANLSAKTAVSMRVEIPHLDYYHSYTVDFVFDESKATKTADVSSSKPVASTTAVTSTATAAVTSATAGVAAQQAADHKAAANTSTSSSTSTGTTTSTAKTPTTTSTTAKAPTATSTTSQVKNPQTSDELPYVALLLLCVSAFFIMRLRKQAA